MGEWEDLARYNAERDRGIVHTAEWQKRMAERQAAFDEQAATRVPAPPIPTAPLRPHLPRWLRWLP